MLELSQEVVHLVEIVAVVLMLPWLAMMIVALLMRQLPRWGYGSAWGSEESRDTRINGF